MSNIGKWEDVDTGVRRNILSVGNGIMMMESQFEAGTSSYEHSHPHEQITYCLKGEVVFNLEGEETILRAGDQIYVPGNAKHSVNCLTASSILDAFTPVREDLVKR
jgi:quercetin dioxygenase-like cupin family protein